MLFLLAAGLTLVFGIMDMINLAHGSLYMIGAYIAASVIEESGADLLVVGCRGIGTFPGGTLGSTSAEVARLTPCPMLLVPDVARSD